MKYGLKGGGDVTELKQSIVRVFLQNKNNWITVPRIAKKLGMKDRTDKKRVRSIVNKLNRLKIVERNDDGKLITFKWVLKDNEEIEKFVKKIGISIEYEDLSDYVNESSDDEFVLEKEFGNQYGEQPRRSVRRRSASRLRKFSLSEEDDDIEEKKKKKKKRKKKKKIVKKNGVKNNNIIKPAISRSREIPVVTNSIVPIVPLVPTNHNHNNISFIDRINKKNMENRNMQNVPFHPFSMRNPMFEMNSLKKISRTNNLEQNPRWQMIPVGGVPINANKGRRQKYEDDSSFLNNAPLDTVREIEGNLFPEEQLIKEEEKDPENFGVNNLDLEKDYLPAPNFSSTINPNVNHFFSDSKMEMFFGGLKSSRNNIGNITYKYNEKDEEDIESFNPDELLFLS